MTRIYYSFYCIFLTLYLIFLQLSSTVYAPPPPRDKNYHEANADLSTISSILSTEPDQELGDDSTLEDAIDFEWSLRENDKEKAPFLFCSNGNRTAIKNIIDQLDFDTIKPQYGSQDMSCFSVYSKAETMKDLYESNDAVTTISPLPSVLKLGTQLFTSIQDQTVFTEANSSISFRLVPSPGATSSKRDLVRISAQIWLGLLRGDYRDSISSSFFWAVDPERRTGNSNRRRLNREDRNLQRRPDRSGDWSSNINSAERHAEQCNFQELRFDADKEFIYMKNIESLIVNNDDENIDSLKIASECLILALAYIMTYRQIIFIENIPDVSTFDYAASWQTQSMEEDYFPFWDVGILGTNEIVQMADTGLDMTSCWFKDSSGNVETTDTSNADFDLSRRKVVQYVVYVDGIDVAKGHGTHVAGTVGGIQEGAAPGDSEYAGIAPNSKIAVFDIGNEDNRMSIPSNLQTKMFTPGYSAGAKIFTNSWGTGKNIYNFLDVHVDTFIYDNPEVLILFAVGNSGHKGTHTVSSPSLSKNALSVGASQSYNVGLGFESENIAYFSSQGPTDDGRIKPDVLAPGYKIWSAKALADSDENCGKIAKMGTSQATPIVAGATTLVRQYYREGYYPTGTKRAADAFTPSGALMKATIINSGVPMLAYMDQDGDKTHLTGTPDMMQGHGRVQLNKVLKLDPTNSISMFIQDWASLAEGDEHLYRITIPSTADTTIEPFKVTITWTDPPVDSSANKLVLHDLDLYVRSESTGEIYYPNGMSEPDTVNNVEKITIDTPIRGDVLSIYVKGTSISTTDTQTYALVASGTFYSGAYYCQNGWLDSYTIENCLICDGSRTNVACCNVDAGETCDFTEFPNSSWDEVCGGETPVCTDAPTKAPTEAPTTAPTTAPTELIIEEGVWYCQNSLSIRKGTSYRTKFCLDTDFPCDKFARNPICCSTNAGNTCDNSDYYIDNCDPNEKPLNCINDPTAAPTNIDYSGSWYCRSPLSTRKGQAYRTTNCDLSCDKYDKEPVCCSESAGSVCTSDEYSSDCNPEEEPVECGEEPIITTSSPSDVPTPSPTDIPTPSPTDVPTTSPPSDVPTTSPSLGDTYSGSWYCRSPLSTRKGQAYRTTNCDLSCDKYDKQPVCCSESAGSVCTSDEYSSDCNPEEEPVECGEEPIITTSSPSDVPTTSPTDVPTTSPSLGDTYSGSWYCRSPLSTRKGQAYRTTNCDLSCDKYDKQPVCCSESAGSVCTSDEYSSDCNPEEEPVECGNSVGEFSLTPSPTVGVVADEFSASEDDTEPCLESPYGGAC